MEASTWSAEPKFAWWGWGFVALLAYLTVTAAWKTHSVLATLLGALAATLCAPMFRKWLWKRTGVQLKATPVAILCTILTITMVSVGGDAQQEREVAMRQKARRESAERVAKAGADTMAYFEANKVAVLKSAADLLQAGKADEALAELNKYAAVSEDPDLMRAKGLVQVQQAKAELAKEDSLPLARKAELYRLLAEAEPGNAAFGAKARRFADEFSRAQKAEAEAKRLAAVAAERKKAIEAQFSSWDGSHRAVERAVKAQMKNPSSYEHVETRYKDTGKGLVVFTTIRGTNSFGGVVPSSFVATVDYDGNVTSLSETR